jgi:plastocyanin
MSARFFTGLIAAVALLFSTSQSATNFTIVFGGTVGLSYSPSFLSVSVGDTVTWVGDFASHPLSSTTIPVGASSWQVGTGSSFSYVVPVPGSYNYTCDVHGPAMSGSFNAAATGVSAEGNLENGLSFRLEQNYPNPFNPSTVIRFDVPGERGHLPAPSASGPAGGQAGASGVSNVRLVVYNLLGREVAVLVNERKAAGTYEVNFDARGLSSGVYFYRLEAGEAVLTRTMTVLK